MHKTLTLNLPRTALLLVDFQEEQRANTNCLAFGLNEVLQRVRLVLEAARAAGIPVIHAAYRRDYEIVPPRPFEPRTGDGEASFSDKDSPLIEICPEVAPSGSETVIYKNDASAFEEGSLKGKLNAFNIEWLIVAGVWTEQCVAASIRDAMAAGFRTLLVKDACTSGTELMHKSAILNLANRLYGGAVADTQRVISLLRGSAATVWYTEETCPIRFTVENLDSEFAQL